MEKKKKKKKESFEKRSPLQHLNPPQFHTPITKNISNPSSSSVSFEAPKGCLRFKLPSNSSSSDPSSSFYSSRTHLPAKPKPLSTIPKNVPHKSTAVALNFTHRSKENVVPRKPFSLKSKNYQPPCLGPRQCARTTTKPNCRNPRIPNLSSGKGNPGSKLNQGSQELETNLKRQNGSGEPPIELFGESIGSCTPAGKIGGGRGLDSVNSDGHENVGKESISETASGDSATSLKTPPVEASVSPEIPCGFQSKMSFPESSATPVCYGAGHLLSGVTDKRKCRRRGSFKGGCEKINLFYDGKNDRNVVCDAQDSSIPLLAEASVRWLLSPCDEGCEDLRSDSENRLQKCQTIHCNASPTLELLSSPSTVCGDVSELGCAICNSSGSGSVGDAASKREDEILVLSPGKNPELGCSEEKMHEPVLITTPNSTSNCNAISAGEEKNFRHNVIENDCALSLGSLSGGNIIQTPNSDSSIDGCSGRTKDRCELFLITETLNKVGLSPRSEMSISDAPGFSFQYADMDSSSSSINLNHIQENIDTVCSWVSDSTLENLALSHVRISWRDGLENRIDEFDSCRCLSDEEVDADGFSDTKLSSSPVSQSRRGRETDEEMKSCLGSHLGDESGANEGNDLGIDNDALPLLLSYEPCISALGKEKRLPNNAESICTNGGDLVASGDSDWTYLRDDHLFQVE
ncbi:hypothetical protein Sango_0695000 [Sesamum angolense]|uniref:Uncharacterized protein n=1 Tax=Sesamum angolense TaxID=2727404 RepID=A0AAE2BZA1_9LAMI|nr:hypothetical protein Sango_0695000 [Sesamum angolense]